MEVTIMELQLSWVEPVLMALAAIVLIVFAVKNKSSDATPPGPWGWPVLGSLPHLGALPHQTTMKLAKRYGPIMTLKLGSVKVLVVLSSKLAKEIVKTHDAVWASKGPSTSAKIMCYGGMDVAFSEYGPRWRNARKVFTLELFTNKRLSDFQKTRKQEIMSGINDAVNECCNGSKAIRIDLVLGKIGTNIVTRMLMNEGILSDKANAMKNTVEFQQAIKDAFRLCGVFYLGDFIPWLDRLDPQGLKKQMYATSKKYDEFLQRVLDDHKMKLEAAKHQPHDTTENTVQDIVDTLLTRPKGVDGQHFSESEIKAFMMDVILAGTDTNSISVEWGFSELLRFPHILEKAHAELDSVVGRDRLVEESDLPNLPYLNAIVKEIFRLHPAAPFLTRFSLEDSEIQGYKIPARTVCLVNIYAIQRDEAVYERPLEFYPERFLGSKKDVHGLDFEFLPFGAGRRMCPGKGLGLLLVQYVTALFIQTCNWSLPGNMKPQDLDVEEHFGLTAPRLNPLQAIVTPRVLKHVLHNF